MRWVTSDGGELRIEQVRVPDRTGVIDVHPARNVVVDDMQGVVHELLFDACSGEGAPMRVALWCLKAVMGSVRGALVWCDVDREMYPPGLWLSGFCLNRLCLLRPRRVDLVWAVAECLRCRGVGAVVGQLPARLSRVEVRRLQLAAELGGGVGILMREMGRGDDIYAAATRWRVRSVAGDKRWQRWKLELVHGQGRQLGESYLLECCRAAEPVFQITEVCVRASAGVGDNTETASRRVAGRWGFRRVS